MARFQYDNLNERQLRIGIALLKDEDALVEALEQALDNAVADAMKPFGIDVGEVSMDRGGAAGGARKQTTKSAGPAKVYENRAPADRVRKVRKPRLSADQTLSRQLQGTYIAAIRRVPASKRPKFKALVKGPGGRQAAIDAIYLAYPRAN